MAQLEFFDIPSPCIGVCQSNKKGYCKGCLRSRDERLYWHQFNDITKKHIIAMCRQRKIRVLAKMRAEAAQADTTKSIEQFDLFD